MSNKNKIIIGLASFLVLIAVGFAAKSKMNVKNNSVMEEAVVSSASENSEDANKEAVKNEESKNGEIKEEAKKGENKESSINKDENIIKIKSKGYKECTFIVKEGKISLVK